MSVHLDGALRWHILSYNLNLSKDMEEHFADSLQDLTACEFYSEVIYEELKRLDVWHLFIQDFTSVRLVETEVYVGEFDPEETARRNSLSRGKICCRQKCLSLKTDLHKAIGYTLGVSYKNRKYRPYHGVWSSFDYYYRKKFGCVRTSSVKVTEEGLVDALETFVKYSSGDAEYDYREYSLIIEACKRILTMELWSSCGEYAIPLGRQMEHAFKTYLHGMLSDVLQNSEYTVHKDEHVVRQSKGRMGKRVADIVIDTEKGKKIWVVDCKTNSRPYGNDGSYMSVNENQIAEYCELMKAQNHEYEVVGIAFHFLDATSNISIKTDVFDYSNRNIDFKLRFCKVTDDMQHDPGILDDEIRAWIKDEFGVVQEVS